MNEPFASRINLNELHTSANQIRQEIAKVIVGQPALVNLLLTALLADGHVLIEGVPGVAKTLTARLLARTIEARFSRIQFTPDLMPSDVIGTSVFNAVRSAFEFKAGPVFANMVLIDEINRAPAKTQAALFEVMEERQVTVDGITYHLEPPFMVLATQNPVEHEGTYRLPEAQLDRFLFKLNVDYPALDEEVNILRGHLERQGIRAAEAVSAVLNIEQLIHYRSAIHQVYAEPHLLEYIARIVHQTRSHPALFLGASPRASVGLLRGAQAFAALSGRDFITPEDIRYIAPHVLRHRIMLTPEKEMEGQTPDEVIHQILQTLEVPR
ncbi:MAG: magnesium chelatase [Cyclobacteriaceae bacterium]|nr:MAG: magnesium chelatase [Cyclobacteriaceae bacterium]